MGFLIRNRVFPTRSSGSRWKLTSGRIDDAVPFGEDDFWWSREWQCVPNVRQTVGCGCVVPFPGRASLCNPVRRLTQGRAVLCRTYYWGRTSFSYYLPLRRLCQTPFHAAGFLSH